MACRTVLRCTAGIVPRAGNADVGTNFVSSRYASTSNRIAAISNSSAWASFAHCAPSATTASMRTTARSFARGLRSARMVHQVIRDILGTPADRRRAVLAVSRSRTTRAAGAGVWVRLGQQERRARPNRCLLLVASMDGWP